MRVEVDRSRCEGHGMCEGASPQVFRLDEDGNLEMLMDEVPEEVRRSVETAVRLCPVAALHISGA
jgi:ferredoxin